MTLNVDDEARWHTITVARMRELLADERLLPTDVLIPNQVRNLAIERDESYVGYVDLGVEEVEMDS